jgi:putative colanic acid biosysnthesis UDP-glucose lipid carrier transferase
VSVRWWEVAPAVGALPAGGVPQKEGHSALPRGGEEELSRSLSHAVAAQPPVGASGALAFVLPALVSSLVLMLCFLVRRQDLDEGFRTFAVTAVLLSFPGANRFRQRPARIAAGLVVSWIGSLLLLALLAWWIPSWRQLDIVALLMWAGLTPLAHFLAVLCGQAGIRWVLQRPSALRPALIVGAGDLATRMGRVIEGRRSLGQSLVGFIEDRAPDRRAYQSVGRVVGRFDDVIDCVRRHQVRDVYVTLPLSRQPRLLALLDRLCDTGVSIYYVPDLEGIPVMHGRLRTLDGVPLVGLLESPFVGVNGVVKRLSDIVLSLLILLVISPVMLLLAVGVRLSSPGPVIFKQRRNGVDGREIIIYKFRSMTATDDGAVVRQAKRGDPRITPFGAFLRRTSLDELPQFINVLQGQMSIVGPRPHAVAHNEEYRRIIGAYMLRHKIKPGITGWAQILGHRGETDEIGKMVARVACDIDYLRNWSLGLDLRIIARTVWLVFMDRSAY